MVKPQPKRQREDRFGIASTGHVLCWQTGPPLIPIVDLKAQYHSIKVEIGEAINAALESAQFVLGSEVAAFEEEFAAYSSGAHAIALNSGTSALHLALLAAGVGPGDEVITVPFTFVATVAAIEYTGARARFVDIDPHSFTIATYALCGFANLSSIAIQIGGIGALAPSRKSDLARMGLKAVAAGTMANFMSACIAGMLL